MATSNVNMVVPSFSIDIDNRIGGVSIYEVHENVDLNHLVVNAINEEINEEKGNLSDLSDEICIYKVPETLRCFNPEAYTPKTVSIGPIHHGNKEFKRMEKIKRIFLKSFLKRGINNKCLKDYVEIIIKDEKRLRAAYLEPIEFKSQEFVKIIMLDAAFIIESLLMALFPDLSISAIYNEIGFYPKRMLSKVYSDLLLLENQIPFFILQNLFDPIDDNHIGYERKAHLVKSSKVAWVHTPTITELHQAGVKFKAVRSKNWFTIKFNIRSGVLELPHLTIDSDFEEIIRNLMAYEQCHHHIEEYNICDYAIFMDNLINTQDDVQLLVKYEIIINALGDNSKVCALFNNISQGIYLSLDKFYYAKIKKDMIKYCKNPIHPWKANLKQNYFNTPWRTASVVAAILLLLLTIIQALTSVMSLI